MKALSKIYTVLIFVFLYAPIAIMILFSFNSTKSMGAFSGFSLRWYRELLGDADTLRSFYNTVILAVISSAVATVIGTAAAVGIFQMKNKWMRSASLTVTNIPMTNPEIVTGFSMMLLFVFVARLVNIKGVLSFWTILIAHITFNLPYVILSVLPKLRQTDPHLQEAAEDLGCRPVQAFFKTVFPQITSGIITGLIMSFTLSLDDFVITYFTSGPEFQTLPIRIFSMTKKRVTPDMYSLSTILVVVILALLLLVNILQARNDKKKNNDFK